MTSLAKQLQKLAIPGQPSLRQVVSKKKPSLLFDHKEAADIDTEAIFSLGVNGLEELISIDQSFAEFETSLFHESCKDFERTVQMKDVLEDLDRKTAMFLRKLSPYFLLKPAHKCLEWLIRAFRVNSFNVDAIMECVLPYYETNLFARVVQLLPLKDPSSTWHWLRPIQKAGSPLSKLTLVQHCISVQPFLVFVCEMVPQSLKAQKRSAASSPRTVVAFYVSTVLGVLETASTVSEELVSRLIPFILKGLKSTNVEYRAASYMITSQLSTVAKLQEQLYCSLTETISKHLGPELVVEGLACIGVMCMTHQITQLPRKSVKYLLKVDSLVSSISQLAQSHSISPLLTALSSSLLENYFSTLSPPQEDSSSDGSALNVLLSLIEEVQLGEPCAYQLVKELLDKFADIYESFGMDSGVDDSKDGLRTSIGPLAQSLDTKYPSVVDKALEDVFASLPDNIEDGDEEAESRPKRRKTKRSHASRTDWLHCFISLALPQSRHQLLGEGRDHPSSTLVLSVHHPNPSMRAAAVKQLGRGLKEMDMDEGSVHSQREFVTSALLGRLSDDDPSVVLAVLNLKAKVLFSYLSADELIPRLCELLLKKKLHKPSNSEWQTCALLAIEILMSQSVMDSPSGADKINDIIVTSLPLMFVHRHGNTFAGKVAAAIHKTSLAKYHPLFSKFSEVLENEVWIVGCDEKSGRDPQCLVAAIDLMVEHFGRQLASMPPQQARDIMFKLLSVGVADSSGAQASYYTSLAVVAYALKYLPTAHHSESDIHEHALGLQMATAFQLLPHIQQCLSALITTDSTNQDYGGLFLPESIAAVFAQLTSKHPNKVLGQALLLLWLLKTLAEHLIVPPRMSTCMWLELPAGIDGSGSDIACLEPLYHHVVLSLFSLLAHCVESGASESSRGEGDADDGGAGLTKSAKILLQTVLMRLFTAPGSLLRFLAMIWTVPLGIELGLPASMSDSSFQDFGALSIDVALQACSLAIAGAYLKSLPTSAVVALVGAQCPVVPSLLIPLMSSYKALREGALNCLDIIQQAIQSKETKQHLIGSSPFIYLLEKIVESKLELATDPSYLQQLFAGILSAESRSDVVETPSKRKRKRRSTAQKAFEEVAENKMKALECLLMHVVNMGAPAYIQHTLLSALEHVEHMVKLTNTLPLMVQLLEKSNAVPPSPAKGESMDIDNQPASRKPFPLSAHEYLTLKLCIGVYVPKMAAHLQTNEDALQLLIKLIGAHSFDQFTLDTLSPQELAINQVTPAFFDCLGSTDLQQVLLQQLIDALLHTRLVHVSTLIKAKIKKLKLSSELVVMELTRHLDQLGGDVPQTPRKRTRRQSKAHPPPVESTPGGGLPLPWKRVTTVLELIQQTSDVVLDVQMLPPHQFNLLSRCLEVEESLRVQLEYTQQLLLSSLLHICSYLTNQGLETARDMLVESQFNVELVVQCIRLSQNPQTHHHALLLLSTAAAIFPNRVLHNIMPIFTFMGAHLLHQDDQYSFQVIAKTIDTVIPPLITSGSAIFTEASTRSRGHSSKFRPGATSIRPSSVGGVVKEIIQVFVDALPHVPDHRRLPLFTHLLVTVGVEDYLHVALGLLVEKQVVQASLDQQVTKEIDATFPVSLALEFSVKNVLLGMLKLTEYLTQLPEEKPTTTSKLRQLPVSASLLFNIAAHTDQQLKQFKLSTLSLLLSLLSQKALTHGVSVIDTEDSTNLEDIIAKLLQCVLGYSTSLNQSQAAVASPQETKFLHSLLKKTYLVVDKVFALLSVGSFVGIVTQLVGGVSPESRDIQRKVIEIFNSRLENGKLKLQGEHDEALLSLVERLLDVAKPDSTPTATRHCTLHGIQLLTRRLGNRYYSEFFKVAQTVSHLCQKEGLGTKVMSSSLLCMSELCRSLGPHTIPLLPSLLPTILKQLDGTDNKARSDSLQLSAANCLATITETLPKFLSSFITDIVTTLCHSKMVSTKDEQPSQLMDKLSQVRLNVSVLVPCRTLLPAYHKCYPHLLAQGKDSVSALLGMLSSTIAELKKEDVKNHNALLLQIFTTVLDYRATQSDIESSAIAAVESQCVEAFSLLVVKLSEALFRPMFLQLLDWATHPSSPKDRLISFYHLTDCITDKLKNLFLLFAGHILKSVATLLDSNHLNKEEFPFFDSDDEDESVSVEKSCLLLRYILQTLTKCFLYDKSGFLTKERFDTLLQPLVDQVTNTMGGSECYRERVESELAPCLAHFAAAAGKDLLWKPLNHKLLLQSRHSDSQIRFALLKVLQKIYTKLGEEFMVLLPETIPFLAELMEDECEEVEREAQTLVSIIEDIMGESIQQYF